jgi:hypothetical protein
METLLFLWGSRVREEFCDRLFAEGEDAAELGLDD